MIAHRAERKLATFDDICGKILDFRLHKFEVMSILKGWALLQKSPTSEKAWNQFLYTCCDEKSKQGEPFFRLPYPLIHFARYFLEHVMPK